MFSFVFVFFFFAKSLSNHTVFLKLYLIPIAATKQEKFTRPPRNRSKVLFLCKDRRIGIDLYLYICTSIFLFWQKSHRCVFPQQCCTFIFYFLVYILSAWKFSVMWSGKWFLTEVVSDCKHSLKSKYLCLQFSNNLHLWSTCTCFSLHWLLLLIIIIIMLWLSCCTLKHGRENCSLYYIFLLYFCMNKYVFLKKNNTVFYGSRERK